MIILQCAIIFGCLAIGEVIVYFTGVKLPSSIIGMLLLTLFLKLGWIKLEWVKGISDELVKALPFFFVPAGVAVMLYFNLILSSVWAIVVAALASTLLTMVVTGWVHQSFRDGTKKTGRTRRINN
jgi:holin-like protein